MFLIGQDQEHTHWGKVKVIACQDKNPLMESESCDPDRTRQPPFGIPEELEFNKNQTPSNFTSYECPTLLSVKPSCHHILTENLLLLGKEGI